VTKALEELAIHRFHISGDAVIDRDVLADAMAKAVTVDTCYNSEYLMAAFSALLRPSCMLLKLTASGWRMYETAAPDESEFVTRCIATNRTLKTLQLESASGWIRLAALRGVADSPTLHGIKIPITDDDHFVPIPTEIKEAARAALRAPALREFYESGFLYSAFDFVKTEWPDAVRGRGFIARYSSAK
jgi:hypothetical protein